MVELTFIQQTKQYFPCKVITVVYKNEKPRKIDLVRNLAIARCQTNNG